MHRICKKLICVFTILFLLSSCSLLHEDMTKVNDAITREDYSAAIMQLNDMDSSFAKKLNSKTHVDYAISILRNIKQEKRARYITAKDILEKAVQLNPKNEDAKTYYLIMLKLSKNV